MDAIDQYIFYMNQYPHLFNPNELISIVTDETVIRAYAQATGKKVGVIFENQYVVIVADLIQGKKDMHYTYIRMLNTRPYAGVVVIPYYQGKIVLLNQFRHSIRDYSLELPRGFSESSLTIEDNVRCEIQEELGAEAKEITYIGSVLSDTGLIGGLVHILSCTLDTIGDEFPAEEGIESVIYLTEEEVINNIASNKIRDCFTISAIYKKLIYKG